ncbi:hypothetical protein EB796_013706 [Bugula neritina]|uniref:Uncharacterized protein n=1 Tax=Bugula neritina TaxID=10212 RepID=A0A7J7JRB8_BUGNE|nr:hypothetical protein EB796_013706 [Bugula neritina]
MAHGISTIACKIRVLREPSKLSKTTQQLACTPWHTYKVFSSIAMPVGCEISDYYAILCSCQHQQPLLHCYYAKTNRIGLHDHTYAALGHPVM